MTVATTPRRHILTVNLEDYFHVSPLSEAIPQRYWSRFESRVEQNTLKVLDLLDDVDCKATFFTLGWIADHAPDVLREVVRRGHEVASKGYHHRALAQMNRDEFRDDAVRSRIALEQACGQAVRGYRIARGWFSTDDLWALDILAEEGFDYDSSLRPIGPASRFGKDVRVPFQRAVGDRTITELPLAATRVGPMLLPVSGGNYVRQLPDGFVRERIGDWVKTTDAPLVFYFHVWELDAEQPRINAVPMLSRLRQYRNLSQMPQRIREYLETYKFTSAAGYLELPEKAVEQRRRSSVVPAVTSMTAAEAGPARDVTIIVPCYNEEETVRYLARTLQRLNEDHGDKFAFRFVFVDDGSVDDTVGALRRVFGARDDCKIVEHGVNKGIASACVTGAKAAETDTVCVIDADCSFDPDLLAKMIPLLKPGVAMVTASPYHRDGGVQNVPAWRLVLSRGASSLYAFVLHNKLASYTACFRVYRRGDLAAMELRNLGFTGIAEILARIDLDGGRVVECPAILESRLLGFSKMKVLRTIGEHVRLIGELAYERFTDRKGKDDSVGPGNLHLHDGKAD